MVAIGDELTSDEQALLLVVHDHKQTLNVFDQTQGTQEKGRSRSPSVRTRRRSHSTFDTHSSIGTPRASAITSSASSCARSRQGSSLRWTGRTNRDGSLKRSWLPWLRKCRFAASQGQSWDTEKFERFLRTVQRSLRFETEEPSTLRLKDKFWFVGRASARTARPLVRTFIEAASASSGVSLDACP